MNTRELINKALEAREGAYVPYSKFYVGAALLTEDGSVYTGCNIENSSFGATNCAERTAIFKAVSEGHTTLKAIVVVGGYQGGVSNYCAPCGICRQVMSEFSKPEELQIILAKNTDEYRAYTLAELLPLVGTPEGDPSKAFLSK